MKFICDIYQVPHASTRGLLLQTSRVSGTICCTHAVIGMVAVTHRILLQGETELIIRSRVYTQSCMVILAISLGKLVGLRRMIIFLCLFVFCMLPQCIVHSYSYDTYILFVRCLKQNKDAVWSLLLLLVTAVRTDPKYSHSHDILCMYVSLVTFDFLLKYFVLLVGAWQFGSRFNCFFWFE